MSKKSTNNYYITLYGPAAGGGSGDIEQALEDEVQELTGLVVDLEQERDNAILERDEAVAKASDLAQELSEYHEKVDNLTALRASDWEKLKSWNKIAGEKHEELLKGKQKEKALHGLLGAKDGHIQKLVEEYEKAIESLKSDLKRAEDRLSKSRTQKQDVMQEATNELSAKKVEIEQLRKECANKRSQIKGLQAELDEADRERNAWKTRALERQGRAEGLRTELIEAQNELDATKESGQYFADRTDALAQQVKDLQDQLDEAKKFARSWQDMYNNLEIQRSLAEHSATYWHDKYYGTTS